MKKLCTLAFMLAMPALHAATLEKPVPSTTSSSAFSKERYSELHTLRSKIITAHSNNKISRFQRDRFLALHDSWSYAGVKFEEINEQTLLVKRVEDPESFDSVLTALASVDQTIFNALTKYAKTIVAQKD